MVDRWDVQWATSSGADSALVTAVVPTTVHGRPCVISAGYDGTAWVRDLYTGEPVTSTLITGKWGGGVEALGLMVGPDDGPMVISANSSYVVTCWDPESGHVSRLGEYGSGFPSAVATTKQGWRSFVVTAGDGRVEVWDGSGVEIACAHVSQRRGETLLTRALATAALDGEQVVIAGASDGTLRVWGFPDVLKTSPDPDNFLFPWMLREITVSRLPASIGAVAMVEVDGRTLVLAAVDRWLRLADPASGDLVGLPLSGHTDSITTMSTGVVRGRPVAVTGSTDGTVCAWPLDGGLQIDPVIVRRLPAAVNAAALTSDDRLAVGFGADVAVLAATDFSSSG